MEYDSSSINLLRPAIVFVPNRGQASGSARFTAQTPGQNFYFHEDGLTAVLFSSEKTIREQQGTIKGAVVKLAFLESSPAFLQALNPVSGQFHYFIGNDPANWRTQLPGYERLLYRGLWDGVDLTLEGAREGLKFLWSLNNPSRVSSIRLRYEGAEEIRISKDGSLVIRHALGELIDPAPIAWQEIGGKKKPIACAYALDSNTVSFTLTGTYDANVPLMVDPILPYSTYVGGSFDDYGHAIAADVQGCAYVGGFTLSPNFPVTPGAFQTTHAGVSMAFLTKFADDGKTLVYSTFLGGSSNDSRCNGVALDAQLCAYLTGYTTSADFPVTPGAIQTSLGGEADAFVTKLTADGASLVYSTYLGGLFNDFAYSVAVDGQGIAYITGYTNSDNYPTTPGAFQIIRHGITDAFVSKLSPDGASLVYSTYLGGEGGTLGLAVAADRQGRAYVTGMTVSTDFPLTPGAFQTLFKGTADAFITKFSADGTRLAYSTYLGGTNYEYGSAIAVDSDGCIVVAGMTISQDFPITPSAFQAVYGGGVSDAFVTKLSSDGSILLGSTYLGGSNEDAANALALDAQGRPHVTGYTSSSDFPITPQVVPSAFHGTLDAFVSILSPNLSFLPVSLYLGGAGTNNGKGIALGGNGGVYATGYTNSADFPISPGAFQTALAGNYDAYVTQAGFALLKKASIALQGMP